MYCELKEAYEGIPAGTILDVDCENLKGLSIVKNPLLFVNYNGKPYAIPTEKLVFTPDSAEEKESLNDFLNEIGDMPVLFVESKREGHCFYMPQETSDSVEWKDRALRSLVYDIAKSKVQNPFTAVENGDSFDFFVGGEKLCSIYVEDKTDLFPLFEKFNELSEG